MEADFMVRRAQFLSSIFFLIFWLSGCNLTDKQRIENHKVNATERSPTSVNGVMFQNNEPFTGMIYVLYPSRDTAEPPAT